VFSVRSVLRRNVRGQEHRLLKLDGSDPSPRDLPLASTGPTTSRRRWKRSRRSRRSAKW